jgi:hypothetical protein
MLPSRENPERAVRRLKCLTLSQCGMAYIPFLALPAINPAAIACHHNQSVIHAKLKSVAIMQTSTVG